ncbi:MAG: hypothetical protein HZB09_00905 [Candidatus Yonathbacteria bacterium]|nr:hypothetical protein [Candidatus Yonathbacteria bacterium]
MSNKFLKNIPHTPRDRGAALTLAVLFFVLISIAIVMGSVNPVVRDFNSGSELINSKLSYFTAEAGDEDAIYRVKKGKQISNPEVTTLNGGSVSVAVADIDSSNKEVTSNSTVYSLVRNVKTVLNAGVGSDFAYGAQVGEGGLVMGQNSEIEGTGGAVGNVYSNGPIVGSNGAKITGSATVATSLALDNQAQSTVCNQDNIVGQTNPQIDFAQSFVPSDSKPIYKVSLYIKKVGSSNPPTAYVKIVSDNAGSPSTTSLASATLSASLVTTSYGWVDVTFSSPFTVTAGQTYWLLLDAGQSSSKYWVWCSDSNNGLGNGVGKYKQDWTSGSGSWTQITGDLDFKIYLGAGPGTIDNVSVGGNAYANMITNSTITGTPYCQTGSGNNKACNTSQADPAPLNMPLSQGNIDQWETDAATGGTITGDYTVSSDVSLGPKKITGDLVMTSNNKTLTVTGVLYVQGNVNVSNGSTIKCDVSFGADSCVLVADGWINPSNNAVLSGSGQSGSYVLMISTVQGCNGGNQLPQCTTANSAIDIGNNATGAIFYTTNSMITLENGVELTSVVGYKLNLNNNAEIKYQLGVANTNFASGPGGGWNVKTWNEVQ